VTFGLQGLQRLQLINRALFGLLFLNQELGKADRGLEQLVAGGKAFGGNIEQAVFEADIEGAAELIKELPHVVMIIGGGVNRKRAACNHTLQTGVVYQEGGVGNTVKWLE
jgi:hypothetical protein